jgi:hypothetical protein
MESIFGSVAFRHEISLCRRLDLVVMDARIVVFIVDVIVVAALLVDVVGDGCVLGPASAVRWRRRLRQISAAS